MESGDVDSTAVDSNTAFDSSTAFDSIVVGGGIAGVSAAYELARRGHRVVVLEREPTLAAHATGRSAAHFIESYGNEVVRRLTGASRAFFATPPAGLTDHGLWRPRSFLHAGREEHQARLRRDALDARALVASVEWIDGDDARALMPTLDRTVAGGLWEPTAMELDVAAIHDAYVRGLRLHGGEVHRDAPVVGARREGHRWRVETPQRRYSGAVVVDAAGAWGDEVAVAAGVAPIGLRPLRRTAAVTTLPDGLETGSWPLVAFEGDDGAMEGYCKPEPGGLLISPADETPSSPCDARAEEIDVARALDAVRRWTTLEVRHVRASWAGLRTFTGDRTPVAGFDPRAPGFFWLVGQGGYGIQTAPALARATAGLVVDGALPPDLLDAGLTRSDLAPSPAGRPPA